MSQPHPPVGYVGYAQPEVRVPWPPAPTPPPEPTAPRPYTQVLRGVRHRWWRPLLSLAVVLAGVVLGLVVTTVAFLVGILLDPAVSAGDLASPDGLGLLISRWWAFLINNLFLAWLIPVAVLAVWVGHAWRPRWVVSVVGRVRWAWMGLAALVSLGFFGIATGATFALDPSTRWDPEPQAAVILVVVLLTTPLQAAGEEFLFRGWLSQAVGSWFARPLAGALVAGVVSASAFALAHGGDQGPFLFADRFAFGVVASVLAWRTGGLEAGIAAHALNNMVIFVPVVLSGQLASALDPQSVGDATSAQVGVDVVVLALLVLVLDRLGKRRGLVRTTTLPLPPGQRPPLPPATSIG